MSFDLTTVPSASDICKQKQSKKVWLIHLQRLPVIFVNKDKVRRCGLSTLRDCQWYL